jgi:hypothetical protein
MTTVAALVSLGAGTALAAVGEKAGDASSIHRQDAAPISRPAAQLRQIELRPTTSEAAGDYEVLGSAAISLSKTVGTNLDPNDCAVDETISVPAGTTVQYCYLVTNTGTIPLNFHTLVDDQLGTLFENFPFALAVGASAFATVQVQIDNTVTNTATWSATDELPVVSACSGGNVLIPGTGTSGPAAPYPSAVTMAGAPVNPTRVSVRFTGFSHTFPDDMDWLLVGPLADTLIFLSDVGGSADMVNFDVTIDDAAAATIPDGGPLTAGSWRPTNVTANDLFDAPAPAGPYGNAAPAGADTLTSVFGAQDPNGTWNLYGDDDVGGDAGEFDQWCLDAHYTVQTATANDTATVTALFPNITVDPASLSATVLEGESDSQILTISNDGDTDLDWSLFEDDGFGGGSTAYAVNNAVDQYTVFDVSAPEVLPNIAPFPGAGGFINAGDLVNGVMYILENNNNLYDVDPATGAILDTRTTNAPAGTETWSGMALDPTDGTVYVSSTNVTTSGLYTLDLSTATATLVGAVTNAPALIGIAVDGAGDLWGYDIVSDVLLSIDKSTGAGTVVGPIGFNANFGQGMGWDSATDTLYMASFNATSFAPELRTVDRSTGATTLVGVLGSTTPGGTNQLGFISFEIGLACSSESDLPWLGVTSNSGTTAVDASSEVLVTFFSAGLPVGTYEGLLCVASNDPDTPTIEVPVTMTVDTMPFIDGFETGDTSRWDATVAN